MKEKIAKLLISNNSDDTEIGKELLLLYYRDEVTKYEVRCSDHLSIIAYSDIERILGMNLYFRKIREYLIIYNN